MNAHTLISGMVLVLSFTLFSPFVAAGEPYAKITYPHDGEKLGAMSEVAPFV